MFLVIGRTFKEGLKSFTRNGWLSVASVTVLVLSLFVLGLLFIVTSTSSNILKSMQEKVDISVYFKLDVTPERIAEAKAELEKSSEIQSISYISREEALEGFRQRNANKPAVVQALDTIGENPLPASLVVKAKDPTLYGAVADIITNATFKDDVSRVNYGENKEQIARLNQVVAEVRKVGLALTGIFAAISILIIFNTIRLTIYTRKQDIEVMRLVGASNTYIRLPFIFEGITYGLIATIISMGFLFLVLKFATPYALTVIPSENLVAAYFAKFPLLFGAELGVGIVLGFLSSMIAMRKYLKI